MFSTRVLGCNNNGGYSTIIHGINHAAKQRNRGRRIIINMSIEGPLSQAVHDAVAAANDERILLVVATGNGFTDGP